MVLASADSLAAWEPACCYQALERHLQSPMKRLLLVHNLVHGQSVVHELDDRDFAVELVEGDPELDEQGEMDVESRFFIRVDTE